MSCPVSEGGLYIAGAVICFGSFAMFMKIPPVLKLDLDPVVFQFWKSLWAFLTSFVMLFFTDFQFSPFGIVSATFWVPAGILAVIAVRGVGMSIGQGTWSGMIVLINCFWGILIFEEPLGDKFVTVFGICLLTFGVSGIGFSKNLANFFSKESELTSPLLYQLAKSDAPSEVEENQTIQQINQSIEEIPLKSSDNNKYPRWIGYSCAVLAGLWGGSIYAPLKMASQQGLKPPSGGDFLVSFGIGVGIIQTLILIVYGIIRTTCLKKPFFPDFHWGTLWWAGSCSGIIWAIGNFFSLLATSCLGQAIGFSGCQAGLVIAGLWGVFYFKEVRGLQMIFFFIASTLTMTGVALMMIGKSKE